MIALCLHLPLVVYPSSKYYWCDAFILIVALSLCYLWIRARPYDVFDDVFDEMSNDMATGMIKAIDLMIIATSNQSAIHVVI